jgi:tetratricopeptide (TPR) repeat protein
MTEQSSHLVKSSIRRATANPHELISNPRCGLTEGSFTASNDRKPNRWRSRVDLQQLPALADRGLFSLILNLSILVLSVVPANSQGRESDLLLKQADHFFLHCDYWHAQPLYAKAETLYARNGDTRNALYARISQYPANLGALSFPEVSRFLDKVLRTPLVMDDRALRLRCLIVKGMVTTLFDVPSAEHIWREVQDLAIALKDSTWESRASSELSIAAYLNADYTAAVQLISSAIHDAEASGDQAGLVRALSLLARGLAELGRNEEAVTYADQAISIVASAPDLPYPATAYTAKIQGLIGLKRLVEARGLLNASLERVNDRLYFYPELAVCAGMLAEAEGKVSEAVEVYNTAADLCKRYGIRGYYGNALARLTRLYLDMGQLQTAEQMIMRGIDSNRKVGDIFVLPIRLALAAEVKLRLGKRTEASELLDEATDISEAMLVNAPTVTLKSSLVSFMNDLYVSRFKLAADNPDTAFRVVELARASATAQTIRADREATVPDAIDKQLTQVQYKLLHARTSTERHDLLRQLFRAEQDLGPILFAYYQQSDRRITRPASTLAAIQSLVLTDETIVEYVLAEPTSFCLTITREAAHIYPLPSRKLLEQAVDRYISTLVRKQSDLGSGKELYRQLLGSIPQGELNHRVIVIPDGKLNYLPFETLVEPNGRFLVESHVVSYTSSSTSLQLARRNMRAPAPLPFVGIGPIGNATPNKADNNVQILSGRSPAERGVFDENGSRLPPLRAGLDELLSGAKLQVQRPSCCLASRRPRPLSSNSNLTSTGSFISSPIVLSMLRTRTGQQ